MKIGTFLFSEILFRPSIALRYRVEFGKTEVNLTLHTLSKSDILSIQFHNYDHSHFLTKKAYKATKSSNGIIPIFTQTK